MLIFISAIGFAGEVDSLTKRLQATVEDSDRFELLIVLSKEVVGDSALHYAEKAVDLGDKARNQSWLMKAYFRAGDCHKVAGDYSLAKMAFTNALKYTDSTDYLSKANTLDQIGIIHQHLGSYAESLDFYFQALALRKQGKFESTYSRSLGNIGIIYQYQKEYGKALDFFKQSLAIDIANESQMGQAITYNNIGVNYKKMEYADSAIHYYYKSLKIAEELNIAFGIAMLCGNIGIELGLMDSNKLALEYHNRALKLNEEMGNKGGVAITKINMSEIYLTMNDYDQAINYCRAGLDLSQIIDNLEWQMLANKGLSNIYSQTNDHESALSHYKSYTVLKDSMFSQDKSKEIGKLEAKQEFETAESERQRTTDEKSVLQATAKSRRDNLQYSGILIFLVFIFAGVFMLGRIRIPIRLAEGLIFFSFLLFFEFTLVLLDPYIETYSSGAPAIKLGFNAMLAALIFPLHSLFESMLKGRMIK